MPKPMGCCRGPGSWNGGCWRLVRSRVASGAGRRRGAGRTAPQDDPVRTLVGRLDLEKYKATIKGLTQFGDRRQGTDRNRAAVDWIEAQLKSYGCTTRADQVRYAPAPRSAGAGDGRASRPGSGLPVGRAAAGQRAGAGQAAGVPARGRGGADSSRATAGRTGVNNDPERQPDAKLRALNTQPTTPGPREEVYCTKIGTTHPDEMYIVGGHMDGIGCGEAANDDGSGTALVMELARIFSAPDVADRAVDPLRALEQRGDGAQRRAGVRRRSAGRCRARRIRRARASIPSRSGSA